MNIMEKYRGHKIIKKDGEHQMEDGTKSCDFDWDNKPCGHCDKMNTPEGHDGCLGTLKGIMNGCCGHGRPKDSYVQFLDESTVHGKDAKVILDILKKNK